MSIILLSLPFSSLQLGELDTFWALRHFNPNNTFILTKLSRKIDFFALPFAWHQTGNTFTCGGSGGETNYFFLGGKQPQRKNGENLCQKLFFIFFVGWSFTNRLWDDVLSCSRNFNIPLKMKTKDWWSMHDKRLSLSETIILSYSWSLKIFHSTDNKDQARTIERLFHFNVFSDPKNLKIVDPYQHANVHVVLVEFSPTIFW